MSRFLLFCMAFVNSVAWSYAMSWQWQWFVVETFGLRPISLLQAWGLILIGAAAHPSQLRILLTQAPLDPSDEWTLVGFVFIGAFVSLGIGWVIHWLVLYGF